MREQFTLVVMSSMIIKYHKTPVGELVLGAFDGRLCLADWRYRRMRNSIDKRIINGLKVVYQEGEDQVIDRAVGQLSEYFSGSRKEFDIPIKLIGTEFQQRVWSALTKIPYGETISYLQLSQILGDEKAIRAVASANGANALSILVPCHRVVGSNGELTGYAGGLAAKKRLLSLEGAAITRQTELRL